MHSAYVVKTICKHLIWGFRLVGLCILQRQASGIELVSRLRSMETMLENYRDPCYANSQTFAD